MDNNSKYLSIGSIVLLKGGIKSVMVTGFCVIPNDKPHKMYDYCGYPYPEGCINSNEVCLFNHHQIEKIVFIGYVSEEEESFKKELLTVAQEITVDSDNNIISDNLSETLSLLDDDVPYDASFSINDNIFNEDV